MPDTTSYKDSSWDAIEGPLEAKYGLPKGGMRDIRTKGERSNSNQVSPVGASTVYQVMPETAARIKARYGVDAFSGPAGAAEASALVLRDGMRRTGTWRGGVTQYIGGTNTKAHGPVTRAYVARVMGEAPPAARQPNDGDDSGVYTPPAPLTVDQLLNTRPADLKEAGRPLERKQPDAALTSDASKGRMLDAVTGGKGILGVSPGDANQSGAAPLMREEAGAIRAEAKRASYTYLDRQEAAWAGTILGKIIHSQDEGDTPPEDAAFHSYYVNNRERIEALATNDTEVDWLRTATSREHLIQIARHMGSERKRTEILHSKGDVDGMVAQIGTDLLDPVGLIAGIATGGATKYAGVGSAALKAAGRTGAALASVAAENAAVNMGLTGIMDASNGAPVSGMDYAVSAFAGAGIGLVMSPLSFRGITDNSARDAMEAVERALAATNARYKVTARAALGENATPEQVTSEANRAMDRDVHSHLTALMDEQPDEVRLLAPQIAEGATVPEGQELAGFLTKDPKVREEIISRFHLNTVIADDGERGLAAEMIARAERIDAANPIAPPVPFDIMHPLSTGKTDGTKTILSATGMESTGMRMRNSESPLVRAFALIATESTTGAGGRRYSAALGQATRERLYQWGIMRDNDLFHLFRKEQGVGLRTALFDGKVRKQFDERVFLERENRRGSPVGTSFDQSLSVRQAADMYGKGYSLMRADQQEVGTIGAGRLGTHEQSWVYNPHQLSTRKIARLTPAQRSNLIPIIASQMVKEEDWDIQFATKLAKKMLARANDKQFGSYDVPFNLHSPEGADMVRDALKATGLTGQELTDAIGKFSRGGAQHTKQRIKLDLTADIGGGKRLMDVYNTDNVSLYLGQSRRVSGEVALARYGIMGKHGLKQLRQAAQATGASPKDLEAFDQVAAEFLNTPFGSHNHLYMDNLRIATSVSRLGGMGITQLAEYTNGVAAVGVHGTLSAVGSFGRLAKEVRAFSHGATSENPLIGWMDEIASPVGLDDFADSGLFRVPDTDIQMYGAEQIGIGTRALRGAAHLQASLSGWRMITAVQTRGFAEVILKRAVKYVDEGVEDTALLDMGITPEVRASIKDNLDTIVTRDAKGKITGIDPRKSNMTEPQIANLRAAILRGSSQIIQRTYIGETGKWAHNGMLKILTQFRTFSITSVEKQWGRNVKNYGALRSGSYLLGAMSIAAPIYYGRVYAKMVGMGTKERKEYGDKHLSTFAVAKATMNMVSASGLLSDVIDVGTGAYSSLTGDDAGLADFTGSGGKGGGGNKLIGGQIAPSVGLVNDVATGLSNLSDASGRKKLYKAVPGSNLPYVIPLLNLVAPADDHAGGGL